MCVCVCVCVCACLTCGAECCWVLLLYSQHTAPHTGRTALLEGRGQCDDVGGAWCEGGHCGCACVRSDW